MPFLRVHVAQPVRLDGHGRRNAAAQRRRVSVHAAHDLAGGAAGEAVGARGRPESGAAGGDVGGRVGARRRLAQRREALAEGAVDEKPERGVQAQRAGTRRQPSSSATTSASASATSASQASPPRPPAPPASRRCRSVTGDSSPGSCKLAAAAARPPAPPSREAYSGAACATPRTPASASVEKTAERHSRSRPARLTHSSHVGLSARARAGLRASHPAPATPTACGAATRRTRSAAGGGARSCRRRPSRRHRPVLCRLRHRLRRLRQRHGRHHGHVAREGFRSAQSPRFEN